MMKYDMTFNDALKLFAKREKKLFNLWLKHGMLFKYLFLD